MNDEALFLSVQNNDQKAFEKLFEKYKRPILSYVKRFISNHEKAEEITHEVFLKVYRNRHSFDPKYRFTTWLWTIARNLAFDHLKKKGEVLVDDYSDRDTFAIDQIESEDISAEAGLIEKAQQEVLEDCFGKLKHNEKEALSLRVYSEMSYEEIALTMNIGLGAVKSLINRAKKSLIICVKNCSEKEVK